MGPGTLYGSLGRMAEAGLIRESDKRVDPEMDDERRVYYRLPAPGRKALAAELQRYREVLAVARQRRLSPSVRTRTGHCSAALSGCSPRRSSRFSRRG